MGCGLERWWRHAQSRGQRLGPGAAAGDQCVVVRCNGICPLAVAADREDLPAAVGIGNKEYCCRAGTTTKYAFGDQIDKKQAQFSADKTALVGSFRANAWGLHDMHGNVWEWCEDAWHEDYTGHPPSDGSAWKGGEQSLRVLRGGGWGYYPLDLRSAARSSIQPGYRDDAAVPGCQNAFTSYSLTSLRHGHGRGISAGAGPNFCSAYG